MVAMREILSFAFFVKRVEEALVGSDIERKYVLPIIMVLFDEMMNEMKARLEVEQATGGTKWGIVVDGLGVFRRKQIKDRVHHSLITDAMTTSAGKQHATFLLQRQVRKRLRSLLDIAKTFPDE